MYDFLTTSCIWASVAYFALIGFALILYIKDKYSK